MKEILQLIAKFLLLSILIAMRSSAAAADLYWSADGSTEGGGGATWDTSTAHFGASAGGPFTTIWNNAGNDNAVFEATPGNVTISSSGITLNGTLTDNSGYTFIFPGSTATLTL